MATTDTANLDERAAKPPISVHPAFPGIVALWFAVLLGLGSTVVPVALLDRVVATTGLAAVLPAAAPPLGLTARALVAVAGAVAGALIGLAIARRVANSHRTANSAPEVSPRFISVHEELGDESLVNGHALPINRDRAMTIAEDESGDDFAEADIAQPAAFENEWDDEPSEWDEPADEPQPAGPAEHQEFAPSISATVDEEPRQVFHRADDLERRQAPAVSSHLEPLQFAAPSLARQASTAANEDETVDWATDPLDKLSLVELAQRLGATIERRREWIARKAAQPIAVAPLPALPDDIQAAPADEAAQAMAAYFRAVPDPDSAVAREPASEAPDEIEEVDDWGDGDGEPDEGRFSSLLAMGQPFAEPKTATLRPEAEPAGPAPHPADPDAALRSALATLQRLSSAA